MYLLKTVTNSIHNCVNSESLINDYSKVQSPIDNIKTYNYSFVLFLKRLYIIFKYINIIILQPRPYLGGGFKVSLSFQNVVLSTVIMAIIMRTFFSYLLFYLSYKDTII